MRSLVVDAYACASQVASLTYYIGEELCSDGRIFASQAVVDRLAASERYTLHEVPQPEGGGATDVAVHEVRAAAPTAADADPPPPLPPSDDGRFLNAALLPLAARHACTDKEQCTVLDAQLAQYLRPTTVLMFRIVQRGSAAFATADAAASQRGEEEVLGLLRPVLQAAAGVEVEPCLWLYHSPADAVRAALSAATAARSPAAAAAAFTVSGFGVHHGELLYIEGTDVHWGDPVNTASKLGQDLASGGEVLVSSAARDALRAAAPEWAASLSMRAREVTISKVQLLAYETDDSPSAPAPAPAPTPAPPAPAMDPAERAIRFQGYLAHHGIREKLEAALNGLIKRDELPANPFTALVDSFSQHELVCRARLAFDALDADGGGLVDRRALLVKLQGGGDVPATRVTRHVLSSLSRTAAADGSRVAWPQFEAAMLAAATSAVGADDARATPPATSGASVPEAIE